MIEKNNNQVNGQMNEKVVAMNAWTEKYKLIMSVMAFWSLSLFLIGAALINMIGWDIFYPNREAVEATVVENVSQWHFRRYGKSGSEYDVYVSYEFNGKKYNHVLLRDDITRSKALEEGSKVTIELCPLFPRKTLYKPSIKVLMWLPLSFACFVCGIAIIFAVKTRKR